MIRFDTDYGATHKGKPTIAIKGWKVDSYGKRLAEVTKHIDRYSPEKKLLIEKTKIEQALGAV